MATAPMDTPAKTVFISYRRADSSSVTLELYRALAAQFGEERVFRDLDSIPLGSDFRYVLAGALQRCDVCLVVIGPSWVTIESDGARRLSDPNDFVRLEVEAALNAGMPVIPVLVGGAPVPRAEELPEALHRLSYCNGLALRTGEQFEGDVLRLIGAIRALRVTRAQAHSDKALSEFLVGLFAKDPLPSLASCLVAVVVLFVLVIVLAVVL